MKTRLCILILYVLIFSLVAPINVQSANQDFEDIDLQNIINSLSPSQIAVGSYHACAITNNREVFCWGTNFAAQIGNGSWTPESLRPSKVVGLSGVIKIVAGNAHTCALLNTGGIKCWGVNGEGQLGVGDIWWASPIPVDVIGISNNIVDISAGYNHTCGLTNFGHVKCWGINDSGQLGDGTTILRSAPVDVINLTDGAVKITAGGQHSCAILNLGAVMCWGGNWSGQLGVGTYNNSSTPVAVTGLSNGVQEIAAGQSHTCASLGSGAKCWGRNSDNQLGDGTQNDQPSPVDVISFSDTITALSAGYDFSCALTSQGGVKCWGRNSEGQIGDGTRIDRTFPVYTSGLANGVKAISSKLRNSCVALIDGPFKCWGMNEYGQTGDGTVARLLNPGNPVSFGGNVTQISAGPNNNCILAADGRAYCWGLNRSSQLGDNTRIDRTSPTLVMGLNNLSLITNGFDHTCAIDETGGVWCWGNNWTGQLGDGTWDWHSTPVSVLGLSSGTTRISAGHNHTCAITNIGGGKCWGLNWDGQLGDNTTDSQNAPEDVYDLSSGVIDIASGTEHTCAVLSTGKVKCWGSNEFGQLGDGSTTSSLIPVNVLDLSNAIAISVGIDHSCALTAFGSMKCWGGNSDGELGDGTYIDRTLPVDVYGLTSGVSKISVNGWHSCAIHNGGEVKCWGYNPSGQLGIGTIGSTGLPATVNGLGGTAQSIKTGTEHTCALLTNGQVKCWGSNGYGQLGLGDIPWKIIPVIVNMYSLLLPIIVR